MTIMNCSQVTHRLLAKILGTALELPGQIQQPSPDLTTDYRESKDKFFDKPNAMRVHACGARRVVP
jgi:hypothetical protein